MLSVVLTIPPDNALGQCERHGYIHFLTFCWPCISVYISVFNQLDAQNLFHNKFYFMPLHVSSTYRCDDTRGCVMQFWPPDDEHMCSKHIEAWNKTYCETKFGNQALDFCDRASWANCEVREKTNKMQQLDVYFQQFHSARTPQGSAPQPLPTTSSRTSAAHHVR